MTLGIKIFLRQVTCHILDENLSERVRNIIKIVLDCFVKAMSPQNHEITGTWILSGFS